MPVFSEQFDLQWRLLVVYLFMIGLFLLGTVSLSLPVSGTFEPPMAMIVIYYWAVYRPTLVPAWLVFIAGLAFDLLSAAPLGLNAFIFIVMRWIVTDQRLFLTSQSFPTVWIGYIVISFVAILFQWAIFGIVNMHWTPIWPAMAMFISGVFLFPLVYLALHLSHRLLPHLKDQYTAVK